LHIENQHMHQYLHAESSTKEDHFVDASSSCKDHLQYGKSRNGNIILKEEVQVKWLL
jgi:hypothetical protein